MEVPEWEAVALCGRCGGDIYAGEVYGAGPGGAVCPDCLETDWNGLTPREKAEALGLTPCQDGRAIE